MACLRLWRLKQGGTVSEHRCGYYSLCSCLREPRAPGLENGNGSPSVQQSLEASHPYSFPDSFLTHLLQRWEGRSLDATKGLRCQSPFVREVCPVCCSAYADYVEGALVAACVLLQAKTESEAPFYNVL